MYNSYNIPSLSQDFLNGRNNSGYDRVAGDLSSIRTGTRCRNPATTSLGNVGWCLASLNICTLVL